MRVSLFGDPPGPKTVDIPNPSASNVRSIEVDGHIRFSENNYRPSRRKSVRPSSPRKKRKLDLDVVWRDARNAMVSMHQGDDDLPAGSSRYATGSSRRNGDAKGKGKAKADPKVKGKAQASDSDMDVGEDAGCGLDLGLDLDFKVARRWRAPSPNPLLEIPGELILARESRTKTQYWPAKILAYIRPTQPLQKPKYKVVFFDGVIKHIEPDWFWTTTDDEFTTCKVRPYSLSCVSVFAHVQAANRHIASTLSWANLRKITALMKTTTRSKRSPAPETSRAPSRPKTRRRCALRARSRRCPRPTRSSSRTS